MVFRTYTYCPLDNAKKDMIEILMSTAFSKLQQDHIRPLSPKKALLVVFISDASEYPRSLFDEAKWYWIQTGEDLPSRTFGRLSGR